MDIYLVPVFESFEWQKGVIDINLLNPPPFPNKGDRYIIGVSPTGAWIGQDGNIAFWNGSQWIFILKFEGMAVHVKNEHQWYVYITSWVVFPFLTSKVRAYQSVAQAITANVYTKVNLQSKTFDVLNEFTNSRFTATQSGWYHVDGSIIADKVAEAFSLIYVNGVAEASNYIFPKSGNPNPTVSDLIFLNVGDYIELYCLISKNCNLLALSTQTYLAIHGA